MGECKNFMLLSAGNSLCYQLISVIGFFAVACLFVWWFLCISVGVQHALLSVHAS